MELRHLRYFVAVAEALHISRAATRLRLTQPALSRQIRDLEAEVGVPLLHRHGTRISLTPAGARFADRAREILVAAERAVREARDTAQHLRIGHYGTLWVEHYAPALRTFAKRFSQTILEPVEMTPVELAAALRRGEIDLALLGALTPALAQEFSTRKLGKVAAILAMGASNPMAKRRSYRMNELREATWVSWDERAFPGRTELLLSAAKMEGFVPKIGYRVDSIASVFMQVATSSAVGYVLPLSKQLPHSGVAFATLKPPVIEFEMNIAWLHGRETDPRYVNLADLLAGCGV